jgi:hypothetical protein
MGGGLLVVYAAAGASYRSIDLSREVVRNGNMKRASAAIALDQCNDRAFILGAARAARMVRTVFCVAAKRAVLRSSEIGFVGLNDAAAAAHRS